MSSLNRASLRKILRDQRRSLSPAEQEQAAWRLFHRLVSARFFIRARRIGFYFANDGEMDPLALLFRALQMGKRCYLPVLSDHRPGRVSFAPFHRNDTLVFNRWGIPEPCQPLHRLISPRALDLVFVPLVGFDAHCNRLGMGKGYYDRTFDFRRRSSSCRPRLIGLAYEFQKVDRVPTEEWDVPLDAVVTESSIHARVKSI